MNCLQRPWLKRASSRLEGRTSWIFSSCGRLLSSYNGDLMDPLLWPQGRPVSMPVARGLLGFLSSRCWGLRSHADSRPESQDSSSVLTWILGYFWSLHRRVRPCLEWRHPRAISSRAVAAMSHFPLRGSRDLWLSLEAFPRGFPTRLSHRAVPRATVV